MTLDFEGRVVAVTGAAMGFGRAIARSFAERGAEVYATDVNAPSLAETAQGTGIRTAVVDLIDRAAAAAWIGDVERQAGRAIDILVNNAGGMLGQHHRPVEEVPDADWDAIMALNVNASFATVRAAAPAMKRAGAGRIINISSGAAFRPSRTRIQAYATAKHAVLWGDGHVVDLGNIGGDLFNTPGAINENGDITGFAGTVQGDADGNFTHAFLKPRHGSMRDLGVLSAADISSTGTGINRRGQVVGYSTDGTTTRAFLWQDGTMLDLKMLAPEFAGSLVLANDIDDFGRIVGRGIDPSTGAIVAFVATLTGDR